MTFEELEVALKCWREGLFARSGVEAVPLKPDTIALRRDGAVSAVIDTPWPQTVALAFSDDGRFLAGAGAPCGVCVWRVQTGELVARLPRPRPWTALENMACLPLQFAVQDHFLIVGGHELSAVETSGWTLNPIAGMPVIAIVPESNPRELTIVGPDDNGVFPLETLDLDSFSLSARGSVLWEHSTTTVL